MQLCFFASRLKCLGDLIESHLRCLVDVNGIAKVFDSLSNIVMDVIKVIRSDVSSDLLHYGIFNKKRKEDVLSTFYLNKRITLKWQCSSL